MSEEKQLLELIRDAIEEARILEYGMDHYDRERLLFNAQRLSGAPYSFVRDVFVNNYEKNPF